MTRQLRLDLNRAPSRTRDDFVVAPANEAAVRALDGWPDGLGGVMAVVGPEASGKSHLAQVWADRTGAVVFHDVAAELADLSALEGRPVLVDDADKVDDETLFHLINLAQAPGGGLLLTSRARPQLWSTTLPDLRSRLDAMRVAEIGPPDDVVLWGVLDRFFKEVNVRPSQELLEYLVRRIERSVAAARDVVRRLDEAAGPTHRPVTRAMAREILEAETDFEALWRD